MILVPVAFDKDYIEDDMEKSATEEGRVYKGLGGIRGLVGAPPLVTLIIGTIIGGVNIWVYNTPDDEIENKKLTDEEE